MAGAAPQLDKGLGLGHVFCISSGAMISSGLFVLPGLAYAIAGPGVVWAYMLAGLLAATGALSIAELTTAMPKAGGDYFFAMRAFGPGVGTVAGLLSWFALSLKSAFAVVGMAAFARLVIHLNGQLAGGVLCVAFVALNVLGVREAARVQVFLVVGLFAILAMYILVGMSQLRAELLIPFAPHGPGSIFIATGFVFVSYGGLLKVASVAEEVRDPGRVIPVGLVLSLGAVMVTYTLAVMVTSGVVEAHVLKASLTPLSHGGQMILGRFGYVVLSAGAILAFVSTANAGIMAASRYLLALSRDRLLPPPLSRVNVRFRTPHVALAITGAVMLFSLFVSLKVLVEAASVVLILTYMLSCLSVIVLRESGLQNYRPAFRSPVYPWVQIAGIVGFGFVLFEMGVEAYLISATLILAGFLCYWFYGRDRVMQDTALLHLIERITARELVTGTLEAELRQIVHERDEVVRDRFDQLIEEGLVLDIEDPVELDEFFRLAAEPLQERVHEDAATLAAALKAREAQGSTALNPTLAVPHVVLKGSGILEILVVRAREGIRFSDEAPAVQVVFVIAGTMDERNSFLSCLAAVAQIAGGKRFLHRWTNARGPQGLKDVVLLADRARHG
ncbi:MAG: amino acid permease [Candidatus Brocadiaceae bacterium]|nr:amino acid permease [Candidatus Brocadiaceae bacterium]